MENDETLVEYLRRSYQAVDGLWFSMVETADDFDHALELDHEVWQVLPKIQARKARELTGAVGNGIGDLYRCFQLKLQADGHEFEVVTKPGELRFIVKQCPWLALLEKSGRTHLAPAIAEAICPTEARVWCEEFGGEFRSEMTELMCTGARTCQIVFIRESPQEQQAEPPRPVARPQT